MSGSRDIKETWFWLPFAAAALLVGCANVGGLNTGEKSVDGGPELFVDGGPPPVIADAGPGPNLDAFWEDDPPPEYCGPGDPPDVPPPGGTPECPDDKNREGCPCTNVGETAPCWPGLRADRDRGICHDGTTTCVSYDDVGNGAWGPCVGYQLPVPGATTGAQACNCFSQGQWQIDNLSPCFVTYSGGATYSVSTYMDGGGQAHCPSSISATPPPQPQPGTVWSQDRLNVDCAGQFQLCYTLKAGDAENPQPGDCTLVSVCVDTWYDTPGAPLELPPLPAWTSNNQACAQQFMNSGGYGEMSVIGESIECDTIDDGAGGEYVFLRINYCPLSCNNNPTAPGCENCGNGASGWF